MIRAVAFPAPGARMQESSALCNGQFARAAAPTLAAAFLVVAEIA
jgi:hypothetical protein